MRQRNELAVIALQAVVNGSGGNGSVTSGHRQLMKVGYDVTCSEEVTDRRLLLGIGDQSACPRAPGAELKSQFGADRAAEGRVQNIDREPTPIRHDGSNLLPFRLYIGDSRGSNCNSCRAKFPP